ncbi:MAG TPA: retropepsin-like aspartic protease [Candidatus Angelobacter sp.]|nr:retropepsin-like aspartic protease [Candidatus Angelobacter sp.]
MKKFAISFLLLSCITAQCQTSTDNSILPARTLHGYLMVVRVNINAHGPFDFLVDTGTNTTLLDPKLAAELGLQPRDRIQLASLSHSAGVPRYFLAKVTLGPACIANLEALAAPLTQLRALDHNIRGILGMNFLLHFSFRLNFDNSSMELYPFPETARIPNGLRVPVQINESRLLITVASSAAPHGTWKLALDSGISQLLVFQDRIVPQRESPDLWHGPNRVMQVSTNLAEQAATPRRLNDVSIAEARLPEQEIVVLRNDLQKPTDPQDGLLPAAPFHSVFFDRTTATIIFTPSPTELSMIAMQAR